MLIPDHMLRLAPLWFFVKKKDPKKHECLLITQKINYLGNNLSIANCKLHFVNHINNSFIIIIGQYLLIYDLVVTWRSTHNTEQFSLI
jgi:hypothetical protein